MASSSTTTAAYTGCVKWFNNNLNYGFITVLTEGEHQNKDIFVHQSNIKTKRDCFRTLYSGECVQFDLTASQNPVHPVHAVNVTGFNGVMLHCENPAYRPRRFNNNNNNNGVRNNSGQGQGSRPNRRVENAATETSATEAASEITPAASSSEAESKAPRGKPAGRGRPRKQ